MTPFILHAIAAVLWACALGMSAVLAIKMVNLYVARSDFDWDAWKAVVLCLAFAIIAFTLQVLA